MSYILNIETATKNCSVAIAKDENLLMVKELATENFSHAEKLHLFIAEILHETQLAFEQLSAVAVSKGPGSYTGLRIGVSTAKGLCYALNIPLIAINTLQVLAKQITVENGIILPMIDARRMEVFSAFYNKDYKEIRATKAEIIDNTSYQKISENLHLIGDGALKLQHVLTDKKFNFYPEIFYPSSKEMVALAFDKYK
ncbi:tRNA (adenosine(37)-N6)-threonylcarbamoyltransferase complex dimerization subunit type 1 TsaB, partial [Flavobacterium sp.]|uniref:tRNA (adenosine(37)-N6)-threonylcarbamoyltransferase complex dimerization subunit type 1 TsaB n=1 Tax=Flavobacterium sp. TaxID=239 RepID=UPI00352934D0